MLYNSVIFIMIFLPISLAGWFLLQKLENPFFAKAFLIGMSFWFYGYYNVWYLGILLFSIGVNHIASLLFEKCRNDQLEENAVKEGAPGKDGFRKAVFLSGLFINIGVLFYFKYYNFFLDNCNFFFHTDFQVERIALPLGISFFTFQQISFLVDRYKGKAPCYPLVDYACFVSFFPQLVAGPIVLHSEMLPQIMERKNRKIKAESFFDGSALFILGLGKKVLLADMLAIYVNAAFGSVSGLDMPAAWAAVIFYMLELYFDFSGYTDMSRGIGKMFGFFLPENFDSPLRAVSVRDFWHRWHKTLSRFLTAYIYIPLGGNRKGTAKKCRNQLIVFLVSGFWHGANWTYVLWGMLHGVAMVFETLFPKARFASEKLNRLMTGIFVTLTFGIFRSESLKQAGQLFEKLFLGGFRGRLNRICREFQVPETWMAREWLQEHFPAYLDSFYLFCMFLMLFLSVYFVRAQKAENWIEEKGCSYRGLLILATLFIWAFLSLSQVSTFLYFDF